MSILLTLLINFPCLAYAFFPERLSNHCHGLRRTSSDICTKFDAFFFSHPERHYKIVLMEDCSGVRSHFLKTPSNELFSLCLQHEIRLWEENT
jgi:hypothetical protein